MLWHDRIDRMSEEEMKMIVHLAMAKVLGLCGLCMCTLARVMCYSTCKGLLSFVCCDL